MSAAGAAAARARRAGHPADSEAETADGEERKKQTAYEGAAARGAEDENGRHGESAAGGSVATTSAQKPNEVRQADGRGTWNDRNREMTDRPKSDEDDDQTSQRAVEGERSGADKR